ncbi:MAG: hypothetical protein M3Z85_13540 [Acidobacteriota bacterium]|nr:hypothetical protein [Acidobacteriota bacterium]
MKAETIEVHGPALDTSQPALRCRWFEDAIIILCLRWYFRYKLSYRDLVEMMPSVVCR